MVVISMVPVVLDCACVLWILVGNNIGGALKMMVT